VFTLRFVNMFLGVNFSINKSVIVASCRLLASQKCHVSSSQTDALLRAYRWLRYEIDDFHSTLAWRCGTTVVYWAPSKVHNYYVSAHGYKRRPRNFYWTLFFHMWFSLHWKFYWAAHARPNTPNCVLCPYAMYIVWLVSGYYLLWKFTLNKH